MRALPGFLALAVLAGVSCGQAPAAGSTIKVGAVFPLTGPQALLARQEVTGVEIARDLANAERGAKVPHIDLVLKDITTAADATARVEELKAGGVQSVLGAYSSTLSMPISEAAQARGMLYWEAGAVADQLTGRGYPLVFRVGATGGNLGAMSSHFAATVLAARLQAPPSALRMVIVHNVDGYPTSVATAAAQQATSEGFPAPTQVLYDARVPDWAGVMGAIRAANPDILLLSSYIDDGVRFRRAMLASGLHVKALIGTTMAQCVPDFGAMLGADAIGVFASDRPTRGFNPGALNATGRAIYDRFAGAYRQRAGTDPTEESLAGFAAAWALFHDVMGRTQDLSATGLAASARSLDLPAGTLPNGAGVRFASTRDAMGQNLRAAAVIWQWQGVRQSVTVYPPVFATGTPGFIPLPR
ncbi:MAG: ABC transporter substrate-binding protein [Candidatus Dormibacteraeota bacterium]|nr:ABC transporter substrate-binding protein [Candidatus Dormibacteraeota bacterium]